MKIRGSAIILPADVNTDYIISSRRKRDQSQPISLVPYLFEDLDPHVHELLKPGDVIVAGSGFGCGSAMEIAVATLVSARIGAIIAPSFARTFYRNAVNLGLPLVETVSQGVDQGDILVVTYGTSPSVFNETRGQYIETLPVSKFAVEVVSLGGLQNYLVCKGALPRGLI